MGTDEAQIKRANDIYLNESGPGSYEVKSCFNTKHALSTRANVPSYTMRNKVRGGYSIEVQDEYRGRYSPSVAHYYPKHELSKSSSKRCIIARAPRYLSNKNTTMDKLRASMPVQYTGDNGGASINTYMGQNNGTDSQANLQRASSIVHRIRKNDRYKCVDIGLGDRSDFTNIPQLRANPGSIYNTHLS